MNIHYRAEHEAEELDLTPMIDVVFQLLIFFMVTAAFSLQKSIEIPPPESQQGVAQTPTLEELERDEDFVIVRIDADQTIWVDEAPAPSRQELLAQLRAARRASPASGSLRNRKLLVLASQDARHEHVVAALDAGTAAGMDDIRLATWDEQR